MTNRQRDLESLLDWLRRERRRVAGGYQRAKQLPENGFISQEQVYLLDQTVALFDRRIARVRGLLARYTKASDDGIEEAE